jgi:O-antigen ligase
MTLAATAPAADFPASSTAPHLQVLTLLGAYNQTPSATLYNQLMAFAGLGLTVAGLAWGRSLLAGWRIDGVSLALILMTAVALAAPLTHGLPWSMALTSVAMTLGALLAVQTGRAVTPRQRGGVLTLLCIALVAAGLLSVAVSVVQMFFPSLADGTFIARSGLVGRAVGNMRQPNHLASLLMWACVAAVWLAQGGWFTRRLDSVLGSTISLYVLLFLFVFCVLLSASRTGMIGIVMLALWGAVDARLAPRIRIALGSTLVMFAICWGLLEWHTAISHQAFGAQSRVSEEGAGSPSRIAIVKNAIGLLQRYPLTGSGWGDFNFAWTMTPFPDRPVAFFDHTHNLELQLLVEMGLPLGLLTLGLLAWGLWTAFAGAVRGGAATRCAAMLVAMIGLHSQFEYPLWYAYFLLPAALAFGLCMAETAPASPLPERKSARVQEEGKRRPVLALLGLAITALVPLVVVDYLRIVHIYAPPLGAASLDDRIAAGQRSPLFALQADYAEATVQPPGAVALQASRLTGHHLIDTRLLMSWAKSLNAVGETDKARYLVARLREFRNSASAEWLAECDEVAAMGAAAKPFQCEAPQREYSFRELR